MYKVLDEKPVSQDEDQPAPEQKCRCTCIPEPQNADEVPTDDTRSSASMGVDLDIHG